MLLTLRYHLLDEKYRGDEFVGFVKPRSVYKEIDWKVRYYHPFDKWFRNTTIYGRITHKLRKWSITLQKRIGIWRNKDVTFYKGAQWLSITDDLCQELLENKDLICKLYKKSLNPDESYIQTLIYYLNMQSKVHDKDDEYKSCLRHIDWKRGTGSSPYIWKRKDFGELVKSDMLFARKFSEDDMDFVNNVKKSVLGL